MSVKKATLDLVSSAMVSLASSNLIFPCSHFCIIFYFLFRLISLDIDECLAANQCNIKANCSNLVGSYNCSCLPGYSGNGYECSGKPISSSHSHHFVLFF